MNEIIDVVTDIGHSVAGSIAANPDVAKRALEVAGAVAATKLIVDGMVDVATEQNSSYLPISK